MLEASLLGFSWEEIARLCRTKPRAGRLAGVLAYRLVGPVWLVPFALLYGLLLLLGSEILAKELGTRHACGLAPWLAFPLQPLLWILSLAGRLMVRLRKPVTGRERGKTEARRLERDLGHRWRHLHISLLAITDSRYNQPCEGESVSGQGRGSD